MDRIVADDVNRLLEHADGMAVSLYMPAERRGPETRQNPIRFKNLLRRAESLWAEAAGEPAPGAVFDSARKLLDQRDFWQEQGDGLAVFLSASGMERYRLPVAFEELVVLTDRFHIKPLLRFVAEDRRFYVLALSGNRTRLFRCTRQTVREIRPEEMPASLRETLAFDSPQKQLQFHTGAPRAGDRRAAVHHGQGGGRDERDDALVRFCRDIRNGLHEILAEENAPLVLAGAEPLVSVFREASDYPGLLETGVGGNPDERSPEDLRDAAWSLLVPEIERERERAIERFRNESGGDRTTGDLRRVLPAAFHGRIDLLLVAEGVRRFGRYDTESDTLDIGADPRAGDGDLLDLAAGQTLLRGGSVFPLPPDRMPGDGPVAALLRY
jgi:hypothetical protein